MHHIVGQAQELEQELITNLRYLHQNAELGFEWPLETKLVMDELTAIGLSPKEICQSGVVATIGNDEGKTILLRADMDALPMTEETYLPFKSTTAYAHT